MVAPRIQTSLFALAVLATAGLLSGCNDPVSMAGNGRHNVPVSGKTQSLMSQKNMLASAPILIRTFKKESELEIWKQDASGQYALLRTYPMCRWSGQLGPKRNEGDRQVPEGFYAITPGQMNPNSAYYLSFNVGYPNAYDRAYGRSGSQIMVHGACSSRGCFSMTDEQIADIYALTREAFGGGQKAIQMQSLPFRMSAENLARYRNDDDMPFWRNLKEGADHFEVTKREPQVAICGKRYVFNARAENGTLEASAACPPLSRDASVESAVAAKAQSDEQKVASLVQAGTKSFRRIYHDGDQHPAFSMNGMVAMTSEPGLPVRPVSSSGVREPELISRPEALAFGGVDVPRDEAKGLNRTALIAKAAEIKRREDAAQALAFAPKTEAKPEANKPETKAATAVSNAVSAPAGKAVPTAAGVKTSSLTPSSLAPSSLAPSSGAPKGVAGAPVETAGAGDKAPQGDSVSPFSHLAGLMPTMPGLGLFSAKEPMEQVVAPLPPVKAAR